MRVVFERDAMVVRLAPGEKLAAVRWRELRIPRAAIRRVECFVSPPTFKQLRLPGTHSPGLIKAGSYRTNRGWELWFVTVGPASPPVARGDERRPVEGVR